MTFSAKQFANNSPGDEGVKIAIQTDYLRGFRVTVKILPMTEQELGWQPGEKFTYEIGEAQDAGQLKISRDERGYRACREQSWLKIVFPVWPQVPSQTQKICHCEFEIDDGALIVTLPDWQ